MPYLAWTNGAGREQCRSLLNLLLVQHQQEFKWTPSYTTATHKVPLLSPESHYPSKAPDWPDTPMPIALEGRQLAEETAGAFDVPPAPGEPDALLV